MRLNRGPRAHSHGSMLHGKRVRGVTLSGEATDVSVQPLRHLLLPLDRGAVVKLVELTLLGHRERLLPCVDGLHTRLANERMEEGGGDVVVEIESGLEVCLRPSQDIFEARARQAVQQARRDEKRINALDPSDLACVENSLVPKEREHMTNNVLGPFRDWNFLLMRFEVALCDPRFIKAIVVADDHTPDAQDTPPAHLHHRNPCTQHLARWSRIVGLHLHVKLRPPGQLRQVAVVEAELAHATTLCEGQPRTLGELSTAPLLCRLQERVVLRHRDHH
mmetsp:Transcript_93259/g.200153  ORF Transcript_93259/g.200153 Transcript_93259/m.200153 type:complete len:277 (+) Transcript_93259:37-867(+)